VAFNRVELIKDRVPLRRALVSVYDKTGLEALVLGLAEAAPGIEIYSTGGSHAAIAAVLAGAGEAPGAAGMAGRGPQAKLISIADYTGQAEMAGGLVKTLDWKIYLGLLAESGNASHEADLARLGAVAFDLVVGDLYPFEAAARDPSSTVEELRQRIDIGGPAMIRAAAKNFLRVASVSSPSQYEGLLAELAGHGGSTTLGFRRELAARAFARVSAFDAAIASRLEAVDAAQLAAAYRVE
jgi:phosphoribosylaminoimidazolecarboxamide formyltransferase/IMP cyclohydrolase